MQPTNEEKIRARAYAIWEREGYPEGRDQDHWMQALRELTAEGVVPGHAGLERGDMPHASVEDAQVGSAVATPGGLAEERAAPKRTRKTAVKSAGKTAASVSEPSPKTRPVRKSSAKHGNEAITTPATEGRIKRAVKKPKT
ncbi:MAG TPA: DUF2934 domain-containing protein [Alphaproteobacteria bacterium]|nr:DUF2934 domain-containing protein [Alphaproteobacteria bacterium]